MAEETKKKRPLLAPMLMLALFLIIFIVTGTWILLGKNKLFLSTVVKKHNRPVDKDMDSAPVVKKTPRERFKNAINRFIIANILNSSTKMNEMTMAYCDALDRCDEGILRADTEKFIKRFESDEYYYIKDTETFSSGPFKVETTFGDEYTETKSGEKAFIKTFRLVNAFEVLGSDGVLGYYNKSPTKTKPQSQTKLPDDQLLKSFLSEAVLKKAVERDMNVNGLDCHISIFYPEDYVGFAFETENLANLVDSLYNEKTSWSFESLKILNVPEKFVLVVGVIPEQSKNLPLIHEVKHIGNDLIATMSNVFRQPGTHGIFVHNLKKDCFDFSSEPCMEILDKGDKIFDSVYEFKTYASSKGMEFIRNERFSTPEFDFTIHYASSSNDEDYFRKTGSEIAVSILNNTTYFNNTNTAILIIIDELSSLKFDIKSFFNSKGLIRKLFIPEVEAQLPADTFLLGIEIYKGDNLSYYIDDGDNIEEFTYEVAFKINKDMYYFALGEYSVTLDDSQDDLVPGEDDLKPTKSTLTEIKSEYKAYVDVSVRNDKYSVYFLGDGFNLGYLLGYSYNDYAEKIVSIITESDDQSKIFEKFQEYCDSGILELPFKIDKPDVKILVVKH